MKHLYAGQVKNQNMLNIYNMLKEKKHMTYITKYDK